MSYETLAAKNGCERDTIFDLRRALQTLDRTLRVRAFHLALHYWEGIFLSTAGRWKDKGWGDRVPPTESSKREMLKTMAMITPCFAATVFMSAKTFDYFAGRENKGPPLEEIMDLLVFDESGQVGPEVGLPPPGIGETRLDRGRREAACADIGIRNYGRCTAQA